MCGGGCKCPWVYLIVCVIGRGREGGREGGGMAREGVEAEGKMGGVEVGRGGMKYAGRGGPRERDHLSVREIVRRAWRW